MLHIRQRVSRLQSHRLRWLSPWVRYFFRMVRANAIGALCVWIFISRVFPNMVDTRDHTTFFDYPLWELFVSYALIASGICVIFICYYVFPILKWQRFGPQIPSPKVLNKIFSIPFVQANSTALCWFVGAITLGVIESLNSIDLAILYAVATVCGAVISATICYFQAERTMHILRIRSSGSDELARNSRINLLLRIVLVWVISNGIPLAVIALLIGLTLGRIRLMGHYEGLLECIFLLTTLTLVIGFLTVYRLGTAITVPLRALHRRLALVEKGEYEKDLPNSDLTGIGTLHRQVNVMAHNLAEKNIISDLFTRYVGADVAQQALREGLTSQERNAAIIFIDIIESTTMTLKVEPQEMINRLNLFFHIVVDVTAQYHGLVNKFIGDAALIVFNTPGDHPDYHTDALVMSRELASRLTKEMPHVGFAIGISAGPVIAGLIGAKERYEYTVIGDAVNEAARLVELAKFTEVKILASHNITLHASAEEATHWKAGESVVVRGRTQPTTLMQPSMSV